MDWTQIEKDFTKMYNANQLTAEEIIRFFKIRIVPNIPPQPPEKLNEEENSEFYTTNVTAEIKPKYGA